MSALPPFHSEAVRQAGERVAHAKQVSENTDDIVAALDELLPGCVHAPGSGSQLRVLRCSEGHEVLWPDGLVPYPTTCEECPLPVAPTNAFVFLPAINNQDH